MKQTYLTVAGRIRRELQELTQVVERTINIWQQEIQSSDDYVDATALNLPGFYAGIERVFEIIMEQVSQELLAFADFLEQAAVDS